MRRRLLLTGLAALPFAPAFAQAPPRRIRGTVKGVEEGALTIETTAGEAVRIALAPGYTVGALAPSSLEKIKPGMSIGVVGVGPKEHQRAVTIQIFMPDRVPPESQFAWDSVPDSTMTNAPVLSEAIGSEGRQLTVTVKGERITVTVPPGAAIIEAQPGSPAMLVPGAHVIAFAQQGADGQLSAMRVAVGKDGFNPPF